MNDRFKFREWHKPELRTVRELIKLKPSTVKFLNAIAARGCITINELISEILEFFVEQTKMGK